MPNYHITRDDIKKYKGNPNGAIMPDYVGQLCIDELEKKYYISTNLNNNGWVASSEGIDISSKQDATDNTLSTTDKTITGAINELKAKVDETFQEVDNGKNLIATSIGNPLITKYSTFSAMSEAILGLRRESENETDAREVLYNMMIEDGYNSATSSMTVDELIDLLDRSGISLSDIKQIACGGYHTVILKTDGSIWSCGLNSGGQLGIGTVTANPTFTKVTTNISNDVKEVVCGSTYTFVLKNDGSIYACGEAGYGHLGLGTSNKTTFTKVTTNVKQIACGSGHTFILKNDGSVWSCGYNNYGQLGLGNTDTTYNTFTQVTKNVNNDVKQIACSGDHTFIIKNDGSLWGCGNGGDGQLGLGTNTYKTTFTQITTNINNDIKQIACGHYHTVILKNDGSVWATGGNGEGQLGLNDTTDRKTFTKITTNINNDVKQIACGSINTFIIKNNGSLWACGDGSKGQLGLGISDKKSFTQVTTNINNDVKEIACGYEHTFILKNDGTVWACGSNTHGQLGSGNNVDRSTFANTDFSTLLSEYDIDRLALYNYLLDNDIEVTEDMDIGTMLNLLVDGYMNNMILGHENNLRIILTDEGVNVTEEDDMASLITKTDNEFAENTNKLYNLMLKGGYEVNSGMNMDSLLEILELSGISANDIKQIACGGDYTFILKNDGSLWACGYNYYGQLGLGDDINRLSFNQVTDDVKQVACGYDHTFIIKNDGSLWTCGDNNQGQLGLNGTTNRDTFTKVTTNINNDVKQVTCSHDHTFIIKNDGSVWACGDNTNGELGLGNTTDRTTFIKVNINDVKQIACGNYHTIILKNDGTVWTCGDNEYGQLGLGSSDTNVHSTFTQVNINNVKQIACGNSYTFILKNDGSVWTCGYNYYGQLGLGSSDISKNTFTKVTTNINNDVIQISCGGDHTFILKNDGSLWSCGDNDQGQLGLGTTVSSKNTFTKVTENINNDINQISCGDDHTFILKKNDSVWACGYNYSGQLGLGTSGSGAHKTSFTYVPKGF